MPSLFRRKRGGKESSVWSCEFRDCSGVLRRTPLVKDRRSAEQMLSNIERLRDFRQAGRALDAGLLNFIESIPNSVRDRLGAWGLLDSQSAAAGEPVHNIISSWVSSLRAAGRTEHHAKPSGEYVRKVCTACRFVFLSDIHGEPVNQFLYQIQKAGRSARTANAYLVALRSFLNWARQQGMIHGNPLDVLKKQNEAADRRVIRRDLTESELGTLLDYCPRAKKHHGLTGYERGLIYRLAAESGLRWGEIHALSRGAFTFGTNPAVSLGAKDTKNRKADVLPLLPELAGAMERYFQQSPALPAAKAFAGMWEHRGADMLGLDLAGANIEEENERGRVDFHSLRHCAASRLAKAGVSPQILKELMRHSDIALTMRHYVHIGLETKREALKRLPQIQRTVEAVRTGTDCIPLSGVDKKSDKTPGQNGDTLRHNVAFFENAKNFNFGVSGVAMKTATPESTEGCSFDNSGTPVGIRTPNLLIRSQMPENCKLYTHKQLTSSTKTDGQEIGQDTQNVTAPASAPAVADILDQIDRCAAIPSSIRGAICQLLRACLNPEH